LEVKENIDKKLTAMREIKGDDIEFLYTNRGEEEAEGVAKAIIADIKKTHRPYNDFAILVRANDHSTPFQRALERAHIPINFSAQDIFFNKMKLKILSPIYMC